ncbi:MAG: hypothetical protein QOH06_79 [Acidobacteriota bacterium]|jgi:hypothetical protein|nr:hypothetical protein [Acidobacteriota bacterium]
MRLTRSLCLLLLALTLAVPAFAVPGATDRVPGASLLVPFFETGINSGTHPHDTLLVVTNWRTDNRMFHYHVWDIDGVPTGLSGNITLGSLGSWSVAMRDLLGVSSAAVRTQLTEGPFYRGFVTIDAVTSATAMAPTEASFPFADTNVFEGFIYYTRLSQGSANGMSMIALETVPATANNLVRGFYQGGDLREEIDPSGRRCAKLLATGGTCGVAGIAAPLARMHMRVFRSVPLNGSSRAVAFTWVPGLAGGPSVFCDVPANSCSPNLTYRQYDEAGNFLVNGTIRLDHVVNVIEDASLVGTSAGWISIFSIPNILQEMQVYGFSFNSANPAGNPNLTWDAIFEAYIATDDAI